MKSVNVSVCDDGKKELNKNPIGKGKTIWETPKIIIIIVEGSEKKLKEHQIDVCVSDIRVNVQSKYDMFSCGRFYQAVNQKN